MISTCRFHSRRAAGSSFLRDPQRQPRTSSRCAATCSSHAFVHLPLGHVFRPQMSGGSHPGTFAMVSSWRATVKTGVWRCLTRSTPRLEATAFDAVASTRTRGLSTFAMSATMATAPRASRSTLPHFELVPDEAMRCPPSHVRRRSRPSGLRASRPIAV